MFCRRVAQRESATLDVVDVGGFKSLRAYHLLDILPSARILAIRRGFFCGPNYLRTMSDQRVVSITLPDGNKREVPAGQTVKEIANDISRGLSKRALAAKVDGVQVDLSHPVKSDAKLEILTAKDPEMLEIYRHSSAHLLAAAVIELFPEAKCGVGPPTEEGFFYDFQMPRPFTPEDLEAIEKKMEEIVGRNVPYQRVEMPKAEAPRKNFRELGQDFKLELVEEKGEPVVSCYWLGEFFRFLPGSPYSFEWPSQSAKSSRLLRRVLGRAMRATRRLQRIHATSFFNQKELDEHLHRVEEAKRRDHRKLGRELGLFTIVTDAPGQVFLATQRMGAS